MEAGFLAITMIIYIEGYCTKL